MKNRKAIAALRKFKGPVVGGVLVRDNVMYVQLVKTDLINELKRKDPNEHIVELSVRDGFMYVDNCDDGEDDDEVKQL